MKFKIAARLANAHKGTYGKVLIIAGSEGMSGAAFLSALACYRAGVGLVRIISPESNRMVLQMLIPEAVLRCYDKDTDLGCFIKEESSWADFIILGPGLSTDDVARSKVRAVLQYASSPLLLDADALNVIASDAELKSSLKYYGEKFSTVLTPHPMEASRLLDVRVSEIVEKPLCYAQRLAHEFSSIALLKGSHTTVYREYVDGEDNVFINDIAAPALAKAGSGDVLTGIIAGCFSILRAEHHAEEKGELLFQASSTAVRLHVDAANIASGKLGEHSVLARDVCDMLGRAMEKYICE